MAPNPQLALRPQNWIVLRIRENGYTPPSASVWQIRVCLEGTTTQLKESDKRVLEPNGAVRAGLGPVEPSKRYFVQVWRNDSSSGNTVAGEAKYIKIHPNLPAPYTQAVPVTPVALATPTLEIFTPNGIASPTTSLGIGQFDAAYNADADPIRNGASDTDNFVGSDSRRFWFRLTDSTPMDFKESSNGLRSIELNIFTIRPDGSMLDNNNGQTQITATQTSAGAATYDIRPIMMVTSIDRDEEVHCGLPAGTYPNLIRKRGESDYRLRLAVFDTRVRSSYKSTFISRQEVRITGDAFTSTDRRTLRVHVFVLRQNSSSPLVRTVDELNEQFNWLELTYAVLGIRILFEQHPDAIADGAEMRMAGGRQYHVINASVLNTNPLGLGSDPDVNAINDNDRQAFANKFQIRNHAIRAVYTGGLVSVYGSAFGLAYPDVDASAPIEGCCFFGKLQAFITSGASPKNISLRFPHTPTMAHEIGHIVTNKSVNNGLHFWAGTHACNCVDPAHAAGTTHTCRCQNPGHYTAPNGASLSPPTDHHSNCYNLMAGSRAPRLWDCTIDETAPVGSFNQYTNIRANATYITTS